MKKLYAISTNSIGHSYQGVQMGHAVGKIAAKNPDINWDEQTFVYLTASDIKMEKIQDQLYDENIEFEKFYEPDIGNKLTAITCITDKGYLFKSLKLF